MNQIVKAGSHSFPNVESFFAKFSPAFRREFCATESFVSLDASLIGVVFVFYSMTSTSSGP